MDTTQIDLKHLFQQLGLPDEESEIDAFIASNKNADNTLLVDAVFWNQAQRHFIKEELSEDAHWSELIDQLDVLLRK